MTVTELADKHGKITKRFHDGSCNAIMYNYECYLERTSLGYILRINVNEGITTRYDTVEQLEQAIIELKKR
jgi:hypothetical protein